jgi:hypothetical protein
MNAMVYRELKQRFPNLPIFCTIQYEHMRGLLSWSAKLAQAVAFVYPDILKAEVRNLLKNADMLALSTYPYSAYGVIVDPTYYDAALRISSDMSLPLAIEQTGYISQNMYIDTQAAYLFGSEDTQRLFFTFLLGLAQKYNFRYVIDYVPLDYGYNYGTSTLSMAWAWTGLANSDGTPKEVLSLWDSYLEMALVPRPSVQNTQGQ